MDAGLAGIGRARATAACSLPSFLKSDTLTSKPCTVRDRDPCAIAFWPGEAGDAKMAPDSRHIT